MSNIQSRNFFHFICFYVLKQKDVQSSAATRVPKSIATHTFSAKRSFSAFFYDELIGSLGRQTTYYPLEGLCAILPIPIFLYAIIFHSNNDL